MVHAASKESSEQRGKRPFVRLSHTAKAKLCHHQTVPFGMAPDGLEASLMDSRELQGSRSWTKLECRGTREGCGDQVGGLRPGGQSGLQLS